MKLVPIYEKLRPSFCHLSLLSFFKYVCENLYIHYIYKFMLYKCIQIEHIELKNTK